MCADFSTCRCVGTVIDSNTPGDFSILKNVENLQIQVASLEKIFQGQAAEDRSRIFSLQAKVAELEEKLYRSSDREEQLQVRTVIVERLSSFCDSHLGSRFCV